MEKSYLILTDSGGIQEKIPSLGKPVLVKRNTTERPEVVHVFAVKLVGTNKHSILSSLNELLLKRKLKNVKGTQSIWRWNCFSTNSQQNIQSI